MKPALIRASVSEHPGPLPAGTETFKLFKFASLDLVVTAGQSVSAAHEPSGWHFGHWTQRPIFLPLESKCQVGRTEASVFLFSAISRTPIVHSWLNWGDVNATKFFRSEIFRVCAAQVPINI